MGMENYSVLMSVYGKEKAAYLRDSVESMLAQTAPPDDFVLVCDGALTRDLDNVIAQFTECWPGLFQVIRLPCNQGLGKALNVGLQACKHDLVARMDSDDLSVPERCALQLQLFTQRPDLAIVSGTVAEFESDPAHTVSVKTMPRQQDAILQYAKLRNPFNHPAVMYRKSAVLCAGGYQDAPLHEDYDLWVRMLIRGAQGYNLPQVLCYMRVDNGLYARRGGLQYLKHISSFHKKLYQIGFCNRQEYVASVFVYTVSCLIPAQVRRQLYQKVLRKERGA